MSISEKENYPMLIWQSSMGHWQGVLAEEWEFQWAAGRSEREVTTQLKAYLEWHLNEYGWTPECSFDDASLKYIAVDVRPEYRSEDNRVAPCPETMRIRFPVIYGAIGGNMLGAAIPIIDTFFTYHQREDLERLARHYVAQNLKGKSPDELGRYEMIQEPELRMLPFRKSISKKRTLAGWLDKPEFNNLKEVAEPLPEKGRGRKKSSPAFEREGDVNTMVDRLNEGPVNLCIVGESGSGKSTILMEAVKRISKTKDETKDEFDGDKPALFWRTNAQRLIAGAPYLGQWEARLESVLNELQDASAWLICDSLIDLIKTGGRDPRDGVAMFLMPYLIRSEARIIVEATPDEVETCRRLLPEFLDAFQLVRVQPLSQDRMRSLMRRVIRVQEHVWKVEAENSVADTVIRLHSRFYPYKSFPGGSVKFVERLFERTANERAKRVDQSKVHTAFVRETGLKEWLLKDDVPLVFDKVYESFTSRIVGQTGACQAASEVVTRLKAGMNDPKRPVSVLLFCGPTGVGKTALARYLAEYLFGAGDISNRLLRLDMSEYGFPGAVRRLTMDSQGNPSKFVTSIRSQPFQVVLLDEIEKAAPEVFDLFLNVFDEGRMSDAAGRYTSFRSAIIVMTSNIGVKQGGAIGFNGADGIDYESEVLKFFRPEFYNRIDQVVSFGSFDEASIRRIAELELEGLGKRDGLAGRGLTLEWTEDIVDWLVVNGFDNRLGARPLQRCLEESVVKELSRFLVGRTKKAKAVLRLSMPKSGTIEVKEYKPD